MSRRSTGSFFTGLVSPAVEALRQIESWPVEHAATGVATAEVVVGEHGAGDHAFGCGSVTKLLVAYAALVAAEAGTIDLDEPAGPEGSTVRHLLAHASGLAWDSPTPIGRPGERRIYSNSGFVALAAHLEARAEMPFAKYLHEAVLAPLSLEATFDGDAAGGLAATLRDVLRFGRELLAPALVAPETLAEATSVQFPGLDGVLPGFGRQTPNDWGLGFELRDAKAPHWTGSLNSPATFGHFGSKPGTATFLWVDPERGLACAALADESFGDWAREAWPRLSDAVLSEESPAAAG
jgi:CubicO group peptidase (beta-lactamase class C family)